jgi:hypothetical protein
MELTEQEINNKKLSIDNYNIHPAAHSQQTINAFKKIYTCLLTDGDILSDGEVIDMVIDYLQDIGVTRC